MTQDEVGERSNIQASYISHLEKGKVNPTLSTLKRLSQALEVDCSKILTLAEIYAEGRGEGAKPPPPTR